MGEQQKATAAQQEKIAEQQAEIETLKQQLSAQPQAVSAKSDRQSPHFLNAVLSGADTSSAGVSDYDALPEQESRRRAGRR